jgi:hypothetical protein
MAKTAWTPAQIEILRDLYPNSQAKDMVEACGHTIAGIVSKASEIGVCKSSKHAGGKFIAGRPAWNVQQWTEADDLLIHQLYPTTKICVLEKMMGRKGASINSRASFLQVPKDKGFRSRQQSENGEGKHNDLPKSKKARTKTQYVSDVVAELELNIIALVGANKAMLADITRAAIERVKDRGHAHDFLTISGGGE